MLAGMYRLKIFFGWDVSPEIETVLALQKMMECRNFLLTFGDFATHSLFFKLLYFRETFERQPLAGWKAMQGIVYFLPRNGDVAFSAEIAIAKHFFLDAGKLDKQA